MSPQNSPLPPLKLAPRYLTKVWGGRAFDRYERAGMPAGSIGEAFDASTLPGAVSVVAGGPHDGKDILELHARHGQSLLGRHTLLPFLLKTLDVEEPLSVQVHPGAARSRAMGLPCAKSEGWVVLDAAPGSEVAVGVAPGVGREELRRLCLEGKPGEGLARRRPHRGEMQYLPSGTVHYATGGLVLWEFQRPADATLRLYDWGRPPRADGSGCDLETALDAVFESAAPRADAAPRTLFDDGTTSAEAYVDGFRIAYLRTDEPSSFEKGLEVQAFTVVAGALTIEAPGHAPVTLRALESALLPAALRQATLTGRGAALTCEVLS